MTKKASKPRTGPGKSRKLRVRKETIKDLTVKDRAARGAKGGLGANPNFVGKTGATYCATCAATWCAC